MFFNEIKNLIDRQEEVKSANIRGEFRKILENGEFSNVYKVEGTEDLIGVDLPTRVYEQFVGGFYETTDSIDIENAMKVIGAHQYLLENNMLRIYFKKGQNVL